MSKNSAVLKNHRDKHFKHQRQECGYLNKGVCIEIGWKGVFEYLIAWIRGDRG